jgi:signal transduction protein with GAF and PtsI domain
MTNHHPLTDEKARSLFSFERLLDMSQPLEIEDCMRTAADWQLEQVMEWLDEHLTNYSDDAYRGRCESINDLEDHLKQAMRPTKTQEDDNA